MTIRTYFLLDGAMMNGADSHLPASLSDPSWLYPLYEGKERARLGPILIDGAAAHEAGQLDAAHGLCRALRSRLHASYIASALSAEDMLGHLRKFARVWVGDRDIMFLRFADCRVLPRLAAILTPRQWRAFTMPMMKWEIHLRDGTRQELPLAVQDVETVAGPLILTDAQIDALASAGYPDRLTDQLHTLHGTLPGNLQEQHDWASGALAVWKQAETARFDALLVLAEQVFRSEGRVLRYKNLPAVLAGNNASEVKKILLAAMKRRA